MRLFAFTLAFALVSTGCDHDATALDATIDSAAPVDRDAPTDVDGAPEPGCPAGSTLVGMPSCGSGTLAPAATDQSALSTATRGDVLTLVTAEQSAPCLRVLVCRPASAPVMLFSDDPESPAADGVLYADTVGPGPLRIYVYHANGGTGLRRFSVVALNTSASDAHAQLTARGVAGPSSQYVATGKAAATAWLSSTTASAVTVPAGTRVVLDAGLDALQAGNGELVNAILDYTLDAPLKISIVTVRPGVDAAAATAGLSLLPRDGLHARGTFPGAELTFEPAASFDPASVRRLRLGDNEVDPDLSGQSAVDGQAVTLTGNYGLVYRFHIDAATHVAFALSPRGGAWGAGALVSAGEDGGAGTLALPTAAQAVNADGSAVVLGRFADATTPFFRLISAGGSSLPVDLVAIPLP